MIDFKNAKAFKLSLSKKFTEESLIEPLLVPGEEFIAQYSALRDFVVFTTKRIITVNVQGMSGKKKDFSSLPYSKIQAFSIETAGVFDLDAELELFFSGMGSVKFHFTDNNKELAKIERLIAEKVL